MEFLAPAFILIFLVFLICLLRHQKKRYARLVQFLQASYSWFGYIKFEFQNHKFEISNVGTGNISTGSGGSYHKIKLETAGPNNYFLGPSAGFKYLSIGKIPDTYRKFEVLGREFLIQLKTIEGSEAFKKQILQNEDLQKTLICLLKKDFQYFHSSSSFVIENFQIKKKYDLELSFIEPSCLENFEELNVLLGQFLILAQHLK